MGMFNEGFEEIIFEMEEKIEVLKAALEAIEIIVDFSIESKGFNAGDDIHDIKEIIEEIK